MILAAQLCATPFFVGMVFVNRRAIGAVAVVALSAWLVLGLVPSASASPVVGTSGNYTFSADDGNIPAGAAITGYSGGPAGALVIPDTVVIGAHTYNVTSVGSDAFEFTALTSVTFPSTVTSIGDNAFEHDIGLTNVTLPAGLTHIGQGAFAQTDLVSITIPNGVTDIPFAAFDGADLTSVNFGTGVTTIESGAFNNNNFTSVTDLPSSLTTIGDNAFGQDPNLTQLLIPASVTSIGHTIVESGALTHVGFDGPAPTTFTAAGATGSFGTGAGLTVSYLAANGSPVPIASGGFTNPTWEGYATTTVDVLSFSMQGHGTAPASQFVASGGTPTKPADPTASGYIFNGWFTSPALTTAFNFSTPVTADETAYAGWSRLATTGVSISPFAIPGAVLVLVLGTALILLARRRRAS
jgi:uncharacterized repeat protein (TIGR02543 family)